MKAEVRVILFPEQGVLGGNVCREFEERQQIKVTVAGQRGRI